MDASRGALRVKELTMSNRDHHAGKDLAAFSTIILAVFVLKILANTSAFAQTERQVLPTLSIDPPHDFLRNPASSAGMQWYDSSIANVTLRIYSFRPFAGDASVAFRQTLLGEFTSLDPVNNLVAPPTFAPVTMDGADSVVTARFLDVNGRSHYRVAIVAAGGRAVAIVHVKGETEEGYQRALPSVIQVLSSMHISTAPARLSSSNGDTRTVAGLYTAPRVNLMPFPGGGVAASTYYYLFSVDGRVYRGYGLPKASGGDIHLFDFAAAAQNDPENAGTFEVHGDQLVITMGWQYRYTITTKIPDAQGRITIENSTLTRRLQ
jgi:hypothetical protein